MADEGAIVTWLTFTFWTDFLFILELKQRSEIRDVPVRLLFVLIKAGASERETQGRGQMEHFTLCSVVKKYTANEVQHFSHQRDKEKCGRQE